ncbi:MAG: hypothetical protein ABW207_06150 [Stenotrophomonas chelatiphaga]|nr:hypothetical protein [Stenotrophomonas chelatiphaga]
MVVVAVGAAIGFWRGDAQPGTVPAVDADRVDGVAGSATPVARLTPRQSSGRPGSPAYDPAMLQQVGAKAYSIYRTKAGRAAGDAKQQVLALKPRSDAGDGLATYEIELAVSDCRNLISGEPEASWQAMRRAGMRTDPDFLSKLEVRLGECVALSQDPALYEAPWLARAAEQGSVEAQLLYAIDVRTAVGASSASELAEREEDVLAWRETSLRYLHALADGGNVEALSGLQSVHENGYRTAKDPVAAYAYGQVLQRLSPSFWSDALLAQSSQTLSPSQQRRAAEQAEAIYRRCCVLPGGGD